MSTKPLRHLPLVGGIAAWPIPLVTATLGLGALGLELMELALTTGILGFVAQSFLSGVVVEISPRGLTRGFVLNQRFLGRTTVMAWNAVTSVHTDWRRPGDDTALATTVRDRHGRAIHFTTAMGFRSYRECLAAVATHAPEAQRSGLTAALLSQEPLGPRTIISAAATTGALALVIVALVGIHCLWAQGPSTPARSLDPPTTSPPDR